ncbi:MAG TPA: hypothetical protein VFC00_40710 [Micromonosporaceae bacterium]|nr:hypothetical protein [Micromonosporaceae bacterium]
MSSPRYEYDPADPMPIFPIKAKDALAPEAVAAYLALCRKYRLDGQAREVEKALVEIEGWQARHEDLLQLPTHVHVPAGGTGD